MKKHLFLSVLILVSAALLFNIGCGDSQKHRNYDFLEHFDEAKKENLRSNSLISKGFQTTESILNRPIIVTVSFRFGNPLEVYSEKTSFPTELSGFQNSGFWFKSLPCEEYNQKLRFRFTSDDGNDLNLELLLAEKGYVKIFEDNNGVESSLTSFEKKFVAKNPYMIWLLIVDNQLVVTLGHQVKFVIDVERYKLDGHVKVDNPVLARGNTFRLKYAQFTDEDVEIITRNLVAKNVYKTDVWPINYRKKATAESLSEDSDIFLNRVYVSKDNICKRAIALPGAGKISYDIEIPSDSILYFQYARLLHKDIHNELNLNVVISKDSEVLHRKELVLDAYPGWKEYRFALESLAGEDVTISFEHRDKDGSGTLNEDIIFLSSPVLRTPRLDNEKNVLLISLDTLRPDHLGCYGYRRDTSENIDKLAAESVIFKNAFSHCPWTLPSHSSMLSSLYPLETGSVLGKDHVQLTFSRLDPAVVTIAEYMKSAGYSTFAVTGGGWVSPSLGFAQGFDSFSRYSEKQNSDISEIIKMAIRNIENTNGQKWFGFLHSYEIHEPYLRNYYQPDPSDGKAARAIADYDSGIRYADKALGKLFDYLKKTGQMKDTIIIITSDHGESFYNRKTGLPEHPKYGLHGHNLYDELLRVPLILFNPDMQNDTKQINITVRLVDIMPTIMELTGLDIPDDIRGVSLVNIKDSAEKNRVVYSESIKDIPANEMKSLRSGDYKLMRKLFESSPDNDVKLYNITADPGETVNIALKNSGIVKQYNKRIELIMKTMVKNIEKLFMARGSAKDQKELADELGRIGYLGQ